MTETETQPPTKGSTPLWKRAAAVGAVSAAIVAGGGIAFAATGSGGSTGGIEAAGSTAASTTSPNATEPETPRALRNRLRALDGRALYGTFVTKGKDGTYVTHVVARGTVSAVSATSLTVRSEDGHTTTYVLDAKTAVRLRTQGAGPGTKGAVSDLALGDAVVVTGRGDPATATVVVQITPKASATPSAAPPETPSGTASGAVLTS